jgi:hypothetical protein
MGNKKAVPVIPPHTGDLKLVRQIRISTNNYNKIYATDKLIVLFSDELTDVRILNSKGKMVKDIDYDDGLARIHQYHKKYPSIICSTGNTLLVVHNDSCIISTLSLKDYKITDMPNLRDIKKHYYNARMKPRIRTATITPQGTLIMIIGTSLYKYDTINFKTTEIKDFKNCNYIISNDKELYCFSGIIYKNRDNTRILSIYDHQTLKKIKDISILAYPLNNLIILGHIIYICDPNTQKIYCINVNSGACYNAEITGNYIATNGKHLIVQKKDEINIY